MWDRKIFPWMKREKYAALVIDTRNFGFFVDVPGLGMSGLVHLSSLQDDFYIFEQERGHLIGRRTRRIIKLGDNVTVQVFKVDSFKKQVDFQLVSSAPARAPGRLAPTAARRPLIPAANAPGRRPDSRTPSEGSGRPGQKRSGNFRRRRRR